jgi:hypothetical protein
MEFAILPSVERCGPVWQVVEIAQARSGGEVPVRLCSFGERAHAVAFLHDLLASFAETGGRVAYEAA